MGFVRDVISLLGFCLDLRDLFSRWRRPSRSARPRTEGRAPASYRWGAESGMTTAEYAIGTIAACTFAALLIAIVRSPEIRAALLAIITSALDLGR